MLENRAGRLRERAACFFCFVSRRTWYGERRYTLFEALAALAAVARQGVLDDRVGILGRLDLVHLDGLAFELLVVLEETLEHAKPVAGHLLRLAVGVELRVFRRDGDHLFFFCDGVH